MCADIDEGEAFEVWRVDQPPELQVRPDAELWELFDEFTAGLDQAEADRQVDRAIMERQEVERWGLGDA